jgi:hypothetical protein
MIGVYECIPGRKDTPVWVTDGHHSLKVFLTGESRVWERSALRDACGARTHGR